MAVPAVAVDITDPVRIESELGEAGRLLAGSASVPISVRELVRELAGGIAALEPGETSHIDPYLLVALSNAATGAVLALDSDDPAFERRALRLRLEQLRHVFRDIAAGQPVGEDVPAKQVARRLAALVDVPQRRLAELIGVRERTFQRWLSDADGSSRPEGDDARRLRIVARIVEHLRHSLTGPGVVRWFERPRRELGGRTPASLLDEPDAVGRLLALAAGARSSGAG